MQKRIIIANWKDNKNFNEVVAWFDNVGPYSKNLQSVTVVVCPPIIYLPLAYQLITQGQYKLELGTQDVSQFDNGPFTGEISARQIAQFAKYVVIGHSERRRHLLETADMVLKKAEMSIQFGMTPVICIDEYQKNELVSYVDKPVIISYETPSAISSNPGAVPESPENAAEICQSYKSIVKNAPVIYGGSVDPTTVKNYLELEPISGVLVSRVSLEPESFINLIEASIF